jgi:hypothetical protein
VDKYWWRKGPRSQNPTQPRSVSAWSPSGLTTWHRRVRGSKKNTIDIYWDQQKIPNPSNPLFVWYLHGICKVSELEPAIAHGSCCILELKSFMSRVFCTILDLKYLISSVFAAFWTLDLSFAPYLQHFGPWISRPHRSYNISELAPLVAAMICVTPSWRSSTLAVGSYTQLFV